MNTFIKKIIPLFFGALLIAGCDSDEINPVDPNCLPDDFVITTEGNKQAKEKKITGDVQFIWTANKGAENGKKPEDLLAFVSITAHETKLDNLDRNNFMYTILNADLSIHREIVVAINGVYIDEVNKKGYVTGIVVSDTKGCSGGPNGGHSSECQGGGCAGGGDEHDGGCADDHTDTGGGCSGDHTDTGDTGGGCTGDHTDTGDPGGGCTGDHSDTGDTGGGCSGDHSDTGNGCSGSGGSGQTGGSGNTMSGKNCRVGQIIALKVHDQSTPGAEADGITWRWYDPTRTDIPTVNDPTTFVKLCRKNIIEGNLTVQCK